MDKIQKPLITVIGNIQSKYKNLEQVSSYREAIRTSADFYLVCGKHHDINIDRLDIIIDKMDKDNTISGVYCDCKSIFVNHFISPSLSALNFAPYTPIMVKPNFLYPPIDGIKELYCSYLIKTLIKKSVVCHIPKPFFLIKDTVDLEDYRSEIIEICK